MNVFRVCIHGVLALPHRGGSGFVDLDELELVRSPADHVVGLAAALAPVPEVDPLGGLLPPLGLWPRETAVPCGDASETPLAPLELGSSLLLDPFDIMIGMMLAVRAICLDQSRKFHLNPLLVNRRSPAL